MPLMKSLKTTRICAGPGHIVYIEPEGSWVPDAVVEAADAVGCIVIEDEKPAVDPAPAPVLRRGRPKRTLNEAEGLTDDS
jgi:hypothetical protein